MYVLTSILFKNKIKSADFARNWRGKLLLWLCKVICKIGINYLIDVPKHGDKVASYLLIPTNTVIKGITWELTERKAPGWKKKKD